MTYHNLILLWLPLMLFSCSKKEDSANDTRKFKLNEAFTLAYTETLTCECNDEFSVQFSELVDDSICPPEVECIWEGGIQINATIRLPEVSIIGLFRGASDREYIGQIDTIGDYSINIIDAVRTESERGNPEAYTVELLVTEL